MSKIVEFIKTDIASDVKWKVGPSYDETHLYAIKSWYFVQHKSQRNYHRESIRKSESF